MSTHRKYDGKVLQDFVEFHLAHCDGVGCDIQLSTIIELMIHLDVKRIQVEREEEVDL